MACSFRGSGSPSYSLEIQWWYVRSHRDWTDKQAWAVNQVPPLGRLRVGLGDSRPLVGASLCPSSLLRGTGSSMFVLCCLSSFSLKRRLVFRAGGRARLSTWDGHNKKAPPRSAEFLSGPGGEAGARRTEAGSRFWGEKSLLTHFLSLLRVTDMGQPSSVTNMHTYPSTHAQHTPAAQSLHANLPLHIDTLVCSPLEQMPLGVPAHMPEHSLSPATSSTDNCQPP